MEKVGQRRSWDFQKTISDVNDLPAGKHYAVLVNEHLTYDDGYGTNDRPSTSTKHSLRYTYMVDRQALQEWILANAGKETYKVLVIEPIEVKIITSVEIPVKDL